VRLELPGLDVELATDRGVFSPERIDPGTRILLGELDAALSGLDEGAVVVDVGCGYGPIACAVALRHPGARVVAVDPNPRARALCAANAARLGLEVRVVAPEEVDDGLRAAVVVSNPPIRVGKAALQELLATWLDRLEPHGRAYLVVARHKGSDSLAAWMSGRGHPVRRVRSRKGYRVLEVGPALSGS
jgi:16S rRNA (guanine1207-N2)-methyltransferase